MMDYHHDRPHASQRRFVPPFPDALRSRVMRNTTGCSRCPCVTVLGPDRCADRHHCRPDRRPRPDRLPRRRWLHVRIEKTKNSAAGVPVLLAFTFFMGLMLSRLIAMVLGFGNGASLIMTAFGGTAGVFFVMASLSSVIKRDLSGMGKFLFVGALAIMIGAIINVFVGSSTGMLVISVMAIGVFSAYMLYDLKRIIDGGETNYISATLALYLDIFNVFQSLLMLLGLTSGDD
jgi:FtsH-binding integral membrane protein